MKAYSLEIVNLSPNSLENQRNIEHILNDAAKKGWELVSFQLYNSNAYILLSKEGGAK